jgi:type VI secretion system protein ImpI/type VI secretion system protein
MSLTLTMLASPDGVALETKRLEGGKLVLGRAPNCDWILRDENGQGRISREHCVISYEAGVWTVLDEKSTNGTDLNGQPLIRKQPSRPLRNGDRLDIGPYTIEVQFGENRIDSARPDADELLPWLSKPEAKILFDEFSQFPPIHTCHPEVEDNGSTATGRVDVTKGKVVDKADVGNPWDDPPSPLTECQNDVGKHGQDEILSPPVAGRPVTNGQLLGAFLDGAGATDVQSTDSLVALREAGAAYRAFVLGMREVLGAINDIKNAFRIAETHYLDRRRNPLKYSMNDDVALRAMLDARTGSNMTAAAAVKETLADLRLHELAMLTAMQVAMREFMESLNPAKFRTATEGALLPMQRRAQAFELYEAAYKANLEALSDSLDSPFGKAFARAYETVVTEASGRGEV